MLIELFLNPRVSRASGGFLGGHGPSPGPGEAGSSGFGKLGGRRGFARELGVVPLLPFILLMWDFFISFLIARCLLAAQELIKALPAPSCLTHGGEVWGGRSCFKG